MWTRIKPKGPNYWSFRMPGHFVLDRTPLGSQGKSFDDKNLRVSRSGGGIFCAGQTEHPQGNPKRN